MAVKKIVLFKYDEAVLREPSKPLESVSSATLELIQDLKDTLAFYSDGIGLSAPQIGVHQRVVILRLLNPASSDCAPEPPTVLVNPVIERAGDERPGFDGRLSFPGLYGETVRPHYLRVSGMDEQGQPIQCAFWGLNAAVVHHEIDHLDGVLFIDRLAAIDRLYQVCTDSQGRPDWRAAGRTVAK